MSEDISVREQVARLYDVLYKNGFVGNMKSQAADLKELKESFHEFKGKFYHFADTRESTCPVKKTAKETKEDQRRSIAIYAAVLSSFLSTISVVILLIKTFGG